MRMEPGFEKANEIYFRLGIIYKQQQKFGQSLEVSAETSDHKRSIVDPHRSASSTLFKIHPDHSLKKISGFRSAMYMSNRRM